jgi:CHAT domain-containing protein
VNFTRQFRVVLIAVYLLLVLAVVARRFSLRWTTRPSLPVVSNDANSLLAEANRLSWLGNWYAAGPLYAKAENLFHVAGDRRDEIYARVGRIRARATVVPLDQTLSLVTEQLREPVVNEDAKLRLWCLALKGYVELHSNSASAKRDWSEALQIASKRHETQWEARSQGELGIIAFLEGNTASAVSLVGKAILSAYKTGDIGSQVRLLSVLADGFVEEQRFDEALTMFRRAIQTAEQTPDAGFPYSAYLGEAAALLGLHKPEEGRQALVKALANARLQNMQANEADLLVGLGETAMATENLREAKTDFQEAERISQQMKSYRTLADAAFDLATLNRQAGDLESASRSTRIALDASRHLGDRYYVPRDLTALAEIKAAENKTKEADRLFEQAEDVLDGIVASQHSVYENAAREGSMSQTYLEHFRLAQQAGNVGRALHVLERVRGQVVASHLLGTSKTPSESAEAAPLEGEIAATQLALLRTGDAKKRLELLEKLLEYERKLAFQTNETGLRRHDRLAKPADLRAVQAALTKDEVLAEYVLDEPASFCLVISREAARIITLPAGSKRIKSLTEAYLSDLTSRKSGERLSVELYEILLSNAAMPHKRRLIISPDGILHLLPFESLRGPDGRLLIHTQVVSYTPSATVLRSLRMAPKRQVPRPLLAVGAVDYKFMRALPQSVHERSVTAAVVRGLAQFSGAQLQDLPGSRDEVLAIGKITGHDAELLLGQRATEGEFKALPLSDFRVIHLAVHATSDPQYPDRSALILGADSKTKDDGLLQAREIARFPLRADLVTLSACETGVGTPEGEAGVVGLEQAFLIAGARAVVASLWNVEDHSTTALMKAFYEHLAEHEDKALALAHAKRDILERYGDDVDPYYWAGFVIVGEGAEGVSFGP